jgi:hypothetical protein
MKKQKPRRKGNSRGKAAIIPPLATSHSPEHQKRLHHRLWSIIGVAATIFGVIGGIDYFFGRPWPTDPIFSPGFPSAGSPFLVPFTVTNKSMFPISDLVITCRLNYAKTNGADFARDSFQISGEQHLAGGQSRPNICPFYAFIGGTGVEHVSAAQIAFTSEYKSSWPWAREKIAATSDVFTLNNSSTPPQWMQGEPLH